VGTSTDFSKGSAFLGRKRPGANGRSQEPGNTFRWGSFYPAPVLMKVFGWGGDGVASAVGWNPPAKQGQETIKQKKIRAGHRAGKVESREGRTSRKNQLWGARAKGKRRGRRFGKPPTERDVRGTE